MCVQLHKPHARTLSFSLPFCLVPHFQQNPLFAAWSRSDFTDLESVMLKTLRHWTARHSELFRCRVSHRYLTRTTQALNDHWGKGYDFHRLPFSICFDLALAIGSKLHSTLRKLEHLIVLQMLWQVHNHQADLCSQVQTPCNTISFHFAYFQLFWI